MNTRIIIDCRTGQRIEIPMTQFEIDSLPLVTDEEKFNAIEIAMEKHMDTVAQSDNWDNRWTCAARAGYVNPWQVKAIKFAQWMDSCWVVSIQARADIMAGIRTIPTPDQAIAELPPMVW